MGEQIDIAVDLGVVPAPLPEILTLRQLVELATAPPRQIIEGVLHLWCKMILGGTSKINKFARPGFERGQRCEVVGLEASLHLKQTDSGFLTIPHLSCVL